MKAIVILYTGNEISENIKMKIAKLVHYYSGSSDVDIQELSDEDVAKIVAANGVATAKQDAQEPIIDVLQKSVNILDPVIKEGNRSQMDIAIILLSQIKAAENATQRELIKSAITVLGMYEHPMTLKERFGVTAAAIAAMRAICNNNLT